MEQRYRIEIERVQKNLLKLVRKHVISDLARLQKTYSNDSSFDSIRFIDRLLEKLSFVKSLHKKYFSKARLKTMLRQIATKTDEINLMQARKLRPLKDLGDITDDALHTFIESNVELIRSVESRYINDVQQTILTGFREGRTISDIANQVSSRGKVSISRARFIARDQIGSLNAEITRTRDIKMGISKYRWRNSQDERVRGRPGGLYPDARPSHWHREGKVFYWNKPPKGGHPGQDKLCRCTAEAILDEIISS